MASTALRRLTQLLLSFYGPPAPPPYTAPPASKEKRTARYLFGVLADWLTDVRIAVEYADLAVIDLSKARTESGRKALADQVVKAMATHGFFYVINHGYTQEQVSACVERSSYL